MKALSKSSAARTKRWDVMVTNLKPSLPALPFVADDLQELEKVLALTRAVEARKADLRSQFQQANAELKALHRKGDHLRSRLGSSVKSRLGFGDPALAKYGLQPRSTVVRRRKAGATPPPASPSPAAKRKKTPSGEERP